MFTVVNFQPYHLLQKGIHELPLSEMALYNLESCNSLKVSWHMSHNHPDPGA